MVFSGAHLTKKNLFPSKYEAWKVRELKRIKRDRDEREQ